MELDLAKRLFGTLIISELIDSVTGTALTALNPSSPSSTRYVLVYDSDQRIVFAIHYDYSAFDHVWWEADGLEILVDMDNDGVMPNVSVLKNKANWGRKLYAAASQAKSEIAYVSGDTDTLYRGVAVVLEHVFCAKSILHVIPLSSDAWVKQGTETGMESLAIMLANGELDKAPSFVRERAEWVVKQLALLVNLFTHFEVVQMTNIMLAPDQVIDFKIQSRYTLEDGTEIIFDDSTTVCSIMRDFFVS